MMRLRPEQEAELDVLAEIHVDVVDAKRVMEKRIQEQVERELDALLRRQSRQARRCLEQGVPKTKIGRALGTADWKTINGVLELTAPEARVAIAAEQAQEARQAELAPTPDWEYDVASRRLLVRRWTDEQNLTHEGEFTVQVSGHAPFLVFEGLAERVGLSGMSAMRYDVGKLDETVYGTLNPFTQQVQPPEGATTVPTDFGDEEFLTSMWAPRGRADGDEETE